MIESFIFSREEYLSNTGTFHYQFHFLFSVSVLILKRSDQCIPTWMSPVAIVVKTLIKSFKAVLIL